MKISYRKNLNIVQTRWTETEPRHTIKGACPLTWMILFLLFFWAGSTAAAPPGGPPGAGQAPPPLVTVTQVIEKDVNPPEDFVGRVEAIQAVDLRARVQGFLRAVRFQEGDYVKVGSLLYIIEKDVYEAQVNVQKALVDKARATLTKADQYLKRLQKAHSGAVSATDIDAAVSDALQAKATLQQAQATLKLAQLDLGYTRIKAPISGIIGLNAYTPGNLVGPNSGVLARIVQVDPIGVLFSISENRLPEMQKDRLGAPLEGMEKSHVVRLRLADGEIYPLSGRIDFINNEVDSATGTISLRAVFDNPDGYLIPGQYVNVLISLRAPKRMPVVPQAAVLEDRAGHYVFVVDADGTARRRHIETGETLGTEWAVKDGLAPGETVIVQGIQKVVPGQKVQPMKPGQGPVGVKP